MKNNQNQKAGDNSVQVQAELMVVNQGITEKEVKDMMLNEGRRILDESKLIAQDVAFERINEYINILLPKLVKTEIIDSFSDPAIQALLRKTERKAICTSRKSDYEMLSELIINRVKKDNDYVIKAATNRAVEVIEDISEEALLGITVLFAVINLIPESGISNIGLEVLDSLYGKLVNNGTLPIDEFWIDNLELVQAIKIIPYSYGVKYNEILFKKLDGYFKDGIKKDSAQYQETIKKLKDANLPIGLLVENPYLKDYFLLAVSNEDNIKNIKIRRSIPNKRIVFYTLTDEQVNIVKDIYHTYENNPENINEIKNKYNEQLEEYPNIKKVSLWWDNNVANKLNIHLTTIGSILGQVNARRLDDRVPNLFG